MAGFHQLLSVVTAQSFKFSNMICYEILQMKQS